MGEFRSTPPVAVSHGAREATAALHGDCRSRLSAMAKASLICRPAQVYSRWPVQSTPSLVLSRLAVSVGLGALLVAAAGPAGGASASAPQGTLVFASNRTGVFQIYSIRADGTQLGQLTRGKAADTAPRFSPDGRRIVFSRSPKQYMYDLWVMNADGSGQRRLAAGGSAPAWSPDSRRIAHVTATGRLAIQDVDSRRTITISGRNVNPYWSPNGRLIAFAHQVGDRGDLAVARSDGSGLKTLRRNAAPLGWSPQGEIAFTVLNWQSIGVIRPDGRGARRLLPFAVSGLAWSPDGRRLASVGGELPFNGLHLSSANGAGVRHVRPLEVNSVDPPMWSPDSRWIAISYAPNGSVLRKLLLVAADGSAERPLKALVAQAFGTDYGTASWRPTGATARTPRARAHRGPHRHRHVDEFRARPGNDLGTCGRRRACRDRLQRPSRVCAGIEGWEPARKRVVRLHIEDCVDRAACTSRRRVLPSPGGTSPGSEHTAA